MNQFFRKSTVLFLFYSAVFFILITGLSLLSKQAVQADDASMFKLVIITVILLLLLNIYDIIGFWISGKRREFFVKKLAGATPGKQIRESLFNLVIIVWLSFLLGLYFAGAISAITSVISISFAAIIIAHLSGTALSLAFGWPMLMYSLRTAYRGLRI
ncbi:MAG TPA: hypothetical protein DCM45_04655 [Clostridiales bacterium]|nr:hypothetical protein [Clostridiales bacterium]